ncbi:LicD family protein [Anaerocolumna sp. AGMB13020]|uniref:LicD family protein n=1 Tax=Anaerocolumna sp. AGMB13020 TaxID=3081750 RepID=UPI002954C74A|nr:LicD family protein [Anaerocolumna sp. AGMB13020]WOO35160.1 LicD family protein [Anaerocolumna sp. AGMB13020]
MTMLTQVKIPVDDLEKIKKIELEMLIELDRICRKKNIKYNLCAGTLLGAVRHEGFIPWDDDIDVRMLRSEYNKFCKACETELDVTKFFLQNHHTDKKYRWGFARILRNDTEFVRVGQENLKQKTGIFIDIFPSDGVPERKIEKRIYSILALISRKILWSPVGARVTKWSIKKIGFFLMSLVPAKIPFGIFNLLSKRYDERYSKRVGCMGLKADKSVFDDEEIQKFGLMREWHVHLTELTFENHKFLAPKQYDGWLVECFGNRYMELPPIEKRVNHHTVSRYKLL